MINDNVNQNIRMTMIGIIQSAKFIAEKHDESIIARDLIDAEIFDFGLCDIEGLKSLCSNYGIELPDNLWSELE